MAGSGCGTSPATPSVAAVINVGTKLENRVPFGPDERAAELSELCEVLRDSYAHLETKRAQWGLDLGELCPRTTAAIRQADTWDRYERVMVAFVSEFHDAHVAWRRARGPSEVRRRIVRLGLETRFVADALVVSDVWPGSGAERAGLRRGDRIAAIDGRTVDEKLGARSELRSWSRSEAARYDFAEEWPAGRVEADHPPPTRRLTREAADGAYETLVVEPETAPRAGRDTRAVSVGRRGSATILKIATLAGAVADIDRLLDEIAPAFTADPGPMVIDLRGNPGGHDKAARAVASRLISQPITGGAVRVRLSARARAEHPEWRSLADDPARPGWSLPQPVTALPAGKHLTATSITGLIDAGCRSSCEALALLLRAMGARLVGERTGGSSGAPFTFTLPRSGARVTVSAWAMFDREGRPIEGLGVAPDETFAPTIADISAGRDTALERALATRR